MARSVMSMASAVGRAGLLAGLLAALVGRPAAAEAEGPDHRPDASGGEPCRDWCGTRQAWPTGESGTGPETSPATTLELGVVGETLHLTGGAERAETAALFGFEFRFPLTTHLDSPAAERRMVRLRVRGQTLGWRTEDRGGRAMDLPATSDGGGSVALGLTETVRWFSRWSKLAATVDVEAATGLGVRAGLGLRTTDVSTRAVGAAGLVLGLHSRVGGLRGHARLLRALTADPGWRTGVDIGVGVATRFDWPGFRGPAPVEVWAELRERRGLGDAADVHERELTTGISYVPRAGFSRISLVGIASHERLADGTTGDGRAVLAQLERPFGDL